MLNAIISGKKYGSGFAGRSLEIGEFEGAEDLLTASVFERLSYLETPLLSIVLNHFIGATVFKKNSELTDIRFWPRWNKEDNIGQVEPDVVMYFQSEKILFLIEAKRWDGCLMQGEDQWGAQLKALAHRLEVGLEEEWNVSKVFYIPLGGIEGLENSFLSIDLLNDRDIELQIFPRSWTNLREALPNIVTSHSERLLKDIILSMELHNVLHRHFFWLGELPFTPITNTLIRFTSAQDAPIIESIRSTLPAHTIFPCNNILFK